MFNGESIEHYKNDIGLGIWDYYNAEQDVVNCMHCKFIDSFHLEFRNEKTIYDFTNDGTHFNGAGFSKYAYFCIKCGNSINYSHSYSYC